MGYESRLFIIKRNEYEIGDSIWISGQKLAEIELCCVGHNKIHVYFNEIFKTPIDFDLYNTGAIIDESSDYNPEDYRIDCYGKHCCYTSIDEVIKYMEELLEEGETYWRLKPAIATLKAWKNDVTGLDKEPIVVHWGH